jgi:hypothetical protein
VDTAGSAAIVVGRGAATVVVEVMGVAGALVVVLAVVGAMVIVPVFGADDVLLRRVRS